MGRFELKRIGTIMESLAGNPQELEGVLNLPPFVVLMGRFTFSPGSLQRHL